MGGEEFIIRNADPDEYPEIGQAIVRVYSQLDGFPKESDQPDYYKLLANVGELVKNPETQLLIALTSDGKIAGGVLYIGDMRYYGSGGTATREPNSGGFRLLFVDPMTRGKGLGKLLTNVCINKSKEKKHDQLIIHTTMAMQAAWKMYEKLGFRRSEDLDFMQGELAVFGFRLRL